MLKKIPGLRNFNGDSYNRDADNNVEFFSWAVSTVMTRQNLIPSPDGSRMIHALIPMWDMCNHENGRVSHGDNESDADEQCFLSLL